MNSGQIVTSATGFTVGIGFTLILNVLSSPAHVFPEFVKLNLAVKFDVIGAVVAFVTVKDGIFPEPDDGIPILKSFCHVTTTSVAGVVEKVTRSFLPFEHFSWFEIALKIGLGNTFIVNGKSGPAQALPSKVNVGVIL